MIGRCCSLLALVLVALPAQATSHLFNQIPSQPQSCNTCHASGPGSERNAFGLEVAAHLTGDANSGTVDWATLCNLDADNDGNTNGAELGDPCCTWTDGPPPSELLANPSDPAAVSGTHCDNGVIVVDVVPAAWVCPAAWYSGSDGCDCGCGALDGDCADASLESCASNGCPNADGGFVPSPVDPTACVFADHDGGTPLVDAGPGETPDAPQGWTCAPLWYGAEDGCDCGCGVADPDCIDDAVATCESNGCADASSGEVPDPDDVTQCVVPESEGGLFNCDQQGRPSTSLGALLLLGLWVRRRRRR